MADTPGMLIVTGASRGIGAAVALAAADAGYAVAVNIRVNAVSPGLIETDIHGAARGTRTGCGGWLRVSQ